MLADHIRKLFDYNYWANFLLMDKAAELDNEHFLAATRFPHGGLRDTFAHLLFAEWIWRERCEGKSPLQGEKMPEAEDFADLARLRDFWIQEEGRMQAYLSKLTDEQAIADLHYTGTKKEPFMLPLEDVLSHVVIHGMQHRSEIAQMLTELGHSPGDIDYSMYRRLYAKR
ncbi:MAG: DinB family protein [Anaerolineales bacterium]